MSHVIRIKPHAYVHILNNNTNCTRLEVGPQTYTRKEHEQLVSGPSPMIMIPPRNYCIIQNPVQRNDAGEVVIDEYDQAQLRYGDQEVRFSQDPFPLYPGEILSGNVAPLKVVAANAALRLRCIRDFDDGDVHREAGSEWLFQGPGTYKPRVDVQIVEVIRATIVQENQALHVRAKRAMIDSTSKARKAGESWLIRTPGAYLPNVNEEVVGTVPARVLTDSIALHLRAKRTFVDVFEKERKAGEEWLVTIANAETHIPDVYEEVVNTVNITTLTNRQYCVILNPVVDGNQRLGTKKLVVGEKSFFLQPGEQIEKGRPQDIHVLGAQDALLLRALEEVKEGETNRKPGDLWMIKGPCEFIPPVEVEIVEARKEIPLDENEGIYVRNMRTGKVTSVKGVSYLLKAGEELWEKELPHGVEELLNAGPREKGDRSIVRDKTRVVTYRAPHNSAVQVYDFKANKSRVIFGPDLVMLQPDEQFTVLSLSGGKPKREGQIKSLSILLGPDFMTDIVTVETSDHARLQLQLAYNWHFEILDKTNEEEKAKLFQVPDFVGDVCKAVASRVRGAVAAESFDNFHRNSALIIRNAVFGKERNTLKFQANNLVITNIDVQSVEPIDQRTRDSLQKSVQLAIEITTQSQEAAARHEAERKNQGANGRLERQKIEDEAAAEKARIDLLRLQAETLVLEATGQATADARAKADAAVIVGESEVSQAEQRAQASNIRQKAALEQLKKRNAAEIEHLTQLSNLEISKAEKLAQIEAAKFKQTVDAIGKETIKSIASAGPEMQAKLLQGLGLKGFMITDGNSPINLFNTANGLIGGATGGDESAMNSTF